jgi:hypothetical protein
LIAAGTSAAAADSVADAEPAPVAGLVPAGVLPGELPPLLEPQPDSTTLAATSAPVNPIKILL